MGPFQLFGFVGIKVAHHTAQTLHDAWPDRFPMDPNLAKIAELDVDGIYDWSQGGQVHEEIRELVVVDGDAEPLSGEEIRERALRATAEEAKVMLEEGTVADARDIDTALLLGAGWPFFMGGICKYADETGLSEELFGETLIAAEDQAGS
jgi:3-hydroxyacyl-CoA dehydrogenase